MPYTPPESNKIQDTSEPNYADLIGHILASPTHWPGLPESWRVGVTKAAALWYLSGDDAVDGDAVTVLALAWVHPGARPVILDTLPDFTSRRQVDALERLLLARYGAMRTGPYSYLPALDPNGYALDANTLDMAPRLGPLAEAKETPEPEPVIWRDAPGKGGAVLSRGEVALFSGEGGLGKSYLTLALAVAGALAADLGQLDGPTCGLRVAAGPAVMLSYEDAPPRLYGRLRRMEQTATAGAVHIVNYPAPLWEVDRSGPSRRSGWWADLWRYVGDVGARLVVIDPASSALGGVSAGEGGPVRAFLRGLTLEADRTDCGVLVVTHSTKAARNAIRVGDDPGAGIVAGSAAWYDAARGVLTLTACRENPGARILECVKANYGRKGWGAVLHEAHTPGGDFAGLVFLDRPGDRLDDVRDRTGNGAGRNGAAADTSFKYGANADAGDL